MVGFLFMVAMVVLIGWLASLMIGKIGGIVIGLLIFVLWFRFNKKQGTAGLFKANLSSYFAFRRSGQTVSDALKSMIHARYRVFLQDKLDSALSIFAEIPETDSDETRVTSTVFAIFCLENGYPPDFRPYKSDILKMYRKMSADAGIS